MKEILKRNRRMAKLSYLFLLTVFFISCKEQQKTEVNKEIILMEKYKKKALATGNDYDYGTYLEYAEHNKYPFEKLSVSLLVNHKYKTPLSYYQIFASTIELYNNDVFKLKYLNNLDEANRQFAIHYLKQGAKVDDISCQCALEAIYRNGYGLEKNEMKSDSLYSVLEKDESMGSFYRENKNDKSKIDDVIK
ncbi:hypothetical protein [Flavobacterium sp. 3HN19-14]|uniref:hypothetical protein n=1 Tax=Flavobacterium sp. 3HN19-14 TaxID=3448133 RepID=UPI003EE055B2